MKKLFLAGIAVLFLATGTARAADRPSWFFDSYKRCEAKLDLDFDVDLNARENMKHPWAGRFTDPNTDKTIGVQITFTRNHLRELEAAVRWLKKCRRCYYNWRVGSYCATLKESIEMDKEDLKP
jgi:hypothetical protein